MNRADDFENWLMEYHAEENPEILDDMLPDCFNDWVCDLDSDEWIRLGNKYARKSEEARMKPIRKYLWLNHKTKGVQCIPYGDDGEMQCCGIDFKRQEIDEILEYIYKRREQSLIRRVEGKKKGFADDWPENAVVDDCLTLGWNQALDEVIKEISNE